MVTTEVALSESPALVAAAAAAAAAEIGLTAGWKRYNIHVRQFINNG